MPDPFGPTSAVMLPSSTTRSRSRSAQRRRPYRLPSPVVSSTAVIQPLPLSRTHRAPGLAPAWRRGLCPTSGRIPRPRCGIPRTARGPAACYRRRDDRAHAHLGSRHHRRLRAWRQPARDAVRNVRAGPAPGRRRRRARRDRRDAVRPGCPRRRQTRDAGHQPEWPAADPAPVLELPGVPGAADRRQRPTRADPRRPGRPDAGHAVRRSAPAARGKPDRPGGSHRARGRSRRGRSTTQCCPIGVYYPGSWSITDASLALIPGLALLLLGVWWLDTAVAGSRSGRSPCPRRPRRRLRSWSSQSWRR